MRIEDILKPEYIIENLSADTKEAALKQMGEKLFSMGLVKESFIEAIQYREKNYPSGLPMEGHKIAIPHTDAEHVNESVILFARLKDPLEFSVMGDPDEKIQVQMISMFALKEKKLIGDLLTTLITTYQDDSVLDSLLHAEDGRKMYDILIKQVGANLKGES
ncbi:MULTISPECIES: PTS sugar transporter subunit IIA [unclassified Oceanispirochaeta]|uniref:PTS sugar transporter subunit IIA n=1 Tax=unclassified Oceanispirochaeta TaxID=2635722 RepID=UPI000E099782|nr:MULTISPECIES: PTS sugar transporter subunit IIA [unclassified Oceanispirochaeta]MBF9016696.1 PTS sugar transporter subunit IIA [Oceanispirochaeta sp. M2]NPD73099.1 PTS sugar transporter subunit IIA [Oceanispirochaeta sp. M1]RDG31201.1 PTS sugar transporter subunit IIA [Oceanispirochaeta sp. M1]